MNFEVENPLVRPIEDDSEKQIGWCECCSETLYPDDSILDLDGSYFCCEDCLHSWLGVSFIEGWEVNE